MIRQDNDSQSKQGKSKKSQSIRLVIWCIVTMLVIGVLQLKEVFFADTCAAPLNYQNKNLNFETAVEKLKLKLNIDLQSVRAVGDMVRSFISQSGELCKLHVAGRIDKSVYFERQQRISQQFERLVLLQQQSPAASVSAEQMKSYLEKLNQIKQ